MPYGLIGMFDTGDNSEKSAVIPISASPFTKHVFYSLDLNAAGFAPAITLAVGDLLEFTAEFEVTTDETTFNTGLWCGAILAASATDTTGIEVTEFNGGNITPAIHHDTRQKSGKAKISDPSKHFLNIVGYAAATSATLDLELESDFGRLTATVHRDPDAAQPSRYVRLLSTNTTVAPWHRELVLHDASGPITVTAAMISHTGSYGSFSAANLVDGNTANTAIWMSTGTTGNAIIVDFGAGNEKLVTQVDMYSDANSTDVFAISTSTNGSAYTTVASIDTTGAGQPHLTSVSF